MRQERFGGSLRAPPEAGERHRKTGVSADWVADEIWKCVVAGGGYVTPVPFADSKSDLDRRAAELASSVIVSGG